MTKVIGLSDARSQAVLDRITEATERPDVVHRWKGNDLIVWDNRAVIHRATAFDEQETRRLWRVSVHLARGEDVPA